MGGRREGGERVCGRHKGGRSKGGGRDGERHDGGKRKSRGRDGRRHEGGKHKSGVGDRTSTGQGGSVIFRRQLVRIVKRTLHMMNVYRRYEYLTLMFSGGFVRRRPIAKIFFPQKAAVSVYVIQGMCLVYDGLLTLL